MYVTIGQVFEQTVRKYPNKEALVDLAKNQRWTFTEYDEDVNRLANALKESGIQKGDVVSTFLFNTSELAITYFACAKIGAVINPINFRLKSQEVAFILQDCQPRLVLYETMTEPHVKTLQQDFPAISFWSISPSDQPDTIFFHDRLQSASSEHPNISVKEDDLYAIMYTSGTTGRPKGVLHRHREMIDMSLIGMNALHLRPDDIGLVAAPMFHCAELHCAFLPRVHAGCTNVILHHFDPKAALSAIETERISIMFAAPTMWNMMLQENLADYDLSSMRYCLYGAAPMAPALVTKLKEEMGMQLVQAYGMTEMGPAITFLAEDEQFTKAGSAGKACFNHEVRVVRTNEDGPSEPDALCPPYEVGEIIVQGPCVMKGYLNRPEATEKALYKGWYHSGDLGFMDSEGYLYISDRVDDMIISGGENIYPREVEDVLYEHPGVLDVAVLGEPHEKWGEQVTAIIVKKDGALTEEELEAFCRSSDKLASYKRPRRFIFMEALPRNASGKIQKFLLRQQYTAKSAAN
ncbi:fatty acid--CoA ligase [Fictibacillus iocasae]|uniref:Fatty acid--CoA ligase n=1 Tax=Fictibacillus iocasae TaxID=2715437 RepID=A0ABW2NR96_9BACL